MKSNKLINEKSPYLLQHAHNPVDWNAWNNDSIALAKKENKPIFLSIGYSTCYWCHVMEREVFENEEIAKLMNEYFVNIKVDREERPDIDRVYMTALQAMTGSGGWPMSMFLTPDLKPFYGATYIPRKAKYGRAGFEDVVEQIQKAWTDRNEEVMQSGDNIITQLQGMVTSKSKNELNLSKETLNSAFDKIKNAYDEDYGGFGSGNKFPRPVVFNFLLDYYYHTKDFKAKDIVTFTLKKMYEGGMYDHLAGGFHRYSVDHFWRVPHFEKMLYDQAQLIVTYLDTYLTTKNKFFLFVAEDITGYVLENLKHPEGGFYSAEDAESYTDESKTVKEEGAYYLWTKDELTNVLNKNKLDIFEYYFGIQTLGNTVNDPHEVFGKKNVLFIANDIYDTAKKFDKTPEETAKIIDDCRTKLLQKRIVRPRPHLDDKILTSWNGLMISALAKAFQVTHSEKYLRTAKETADFILKNLYHKDDKKLLHRFRDSESRFEGTLEDYAYLTAGLIDLYESDFDINYQTAALEINESAVEKFYDFENGGFFDAGKNETDVLLKTKDAYDGAEPSGNSIQIMNLLRLGYLTDDKELLNKAEKSLKYFSEDMYRMPFSSPQMLCALSFSLHTPKEIILKGNPAGKTLNELKNLIYETYIPNRVMLHASEETVKLSGFISNIVNEGDNDEIYICENYKCNLPVNNKEDLKFLISK